MVRANGWLYLRRWVRVLATGLLYRPRLTGTSPLTWRTGRVWVAVGLQVVLRGMHVDVLVCTGRDVRFTVTAVWAAGLRRCSGNWSPGLPRMSSRRGSRGNQISSA